VEEELEQWQKSEVLDYRHMEEQSGDYAELLRRKMCGVVPISPSLPAQPIYVHSATIALVREEKVPFPRITQPSRM
jgi:hypothetical protein